MKHWSDYTIELLSPQNVNQIYQLYKDSFKRSKPDNYFHWKYLDNPSGDVIGFMAKSKENELAAFYALLPQTMIIGGQEHKVVISCDGMTHPNHQRRGMFKMLHAEGNRYLEENNLMGISYSGLKTLDFKIGTGWIPVSKMKYFFAPKAFAPLFSSNQKRNVKQSQNLEDISHLLNSINDNKAYHLKTKEIYNWRVTNPQREYQYIYYSKESSATSFAIYVDEGDKIDIFDFYFANKKEGKAIISSLFEQVKAKKMIGVVSMVNLKSAYAKQLTLLGFISNPFKKGPLTLSYPFTIYPGNKDIAKQLENGKDWYLSSFEFDGT